MIIILSHAHPSVSKGGAEVSAYTLYMGLRRLGLPVSFVAMCAEKDFNRLGFDTPDEYAVPFQPDQYDHFFHYSEPAVFERIGSLVEGLNPTTLIFHHFLFLGINTLRRLRERFHCPSVLVLHEFLAICHHHGQMVTKPAKRLCSVSGASRCSSCFPEISAEEFHARKLTLLGIVSSFDHLVSPSHFLAGRFVTWGVEPSKISVIENGLAGFDGATKADIVSPPEKSGRPAARKLNLSAAPKSVRRHVFGYFGQINPFKGVDLILDAAKLLEGFPEEANRVVLRIHGNIVGINEDFRNRFEAACNTDVIDYVGAYDNIDVIRLMSACDYVLLASKWWENSPVVIQEAFCAQRPVIVPAIGGMAEKVTDGINGHHFIFNDAADLARLLLELVNGDDQVPVHYHFPRPATATAMAKSYVSMLGLQASEFNLISEEIIC